MGSFNEEPTFYPMFFASNPLIYVANNRCSRTQFQCIINLCLLTFFRSVAKTFYDRKMFYNIGPLVSVLQKTFCHWRRGQKARV